MADFCLPFFVRWLSQLGDAPDEEPTVVDKGLAYRIDRSGAPTLQIRIEGRSSA